MKKIIYILTAITLGFLAYNAMTSTDKSGTSIFENRMVNLNRKAVAEILQKMNEEKGYTLEEKSLYIADDIQAFSFL